MEIFGKKFFFLILPNLIKKHFVFPIKNIQGVFGRFWCLFLKEKWFFKTPDSGCFLAIWQGYRLTILAIFQANISPLIPHSDQKTLFYTPFRLFRGYLVGFDVYFEEKARFLKPLNLAYFLPFRKAIDLQFFRFFGENFFVLIFPNLIKKLFLYHIKSVQGVFGRFWCLFLKQKRFFKTPDSDWFLAIWQGYRITIFAIFRGKFFLQSFPNLIKNTFIPHKGHSGGIW